MQAEILGFVGFTQQEKDVLAPREAATITEYLRALLAGASSDIAEFNTDLQTHLTDYADPHKVGQSASFLESVYTFLYGYYTDISDTPMSYSSFKEMARTPVWFDFVRKLIVDHNLFVQCNGITGDVTLPVGLDTASADPNATSPTAVASGISSIDTFLSQRGSITGWNTFSDANALGLNANMLKPKFYSRRDTPLLVTGTDLLDGCQSLNNLDLSGDGWPLMIGLRLGVGKTPTDTEVGVLSVASDSKTFTVSYNPVKQTLTVTTTIDGVPAIGPISVPTGIVWMTLSAASLVVSAQQTQGVQDTATDISSAAIAALKSLSITQNPNARGGVADLLGIAVFAGIVDTDALYRQSAYL